MIFATNWNDGNSIVYKTPPKVPWFHYSRPHQRDCLQVSWHLMVNCMCAEDTSVPQFCNFFCTLRKILPKLVHVECNRKCIFPFQVCEEQKCQEEVFLLAVNYMNRFLARCCIKRNQLQLLGTACLLISSKLREPTPLGAKILVFYTDNSITLEELMVSQSFCVCLIRISLRYHEWQLDFRMSTLLFNILKLLTIRFYRN